MPEQLRQLFSADLLAWCKSWECWPFLLSTATFMDDKKINRTRIFEAVLIGILSAALVAGASTMFLVPAIKESFVEFKTDMKLEITTLRSDIHNAKIQIGDRWTESEHLDYERGHNDKHEREWNRHDDREGVSR